MFNFFLDHYNPLYYIVESSRMQISPTRLAIKAALHSLENTYNPIHYTEYGKTMHACLEIAERMTRKYTKPEFGITETTINGKQYKIKQNVVLSKTFCHLQHFSKPGLHTTQPKLLIVAPMAGHHATLLRGTVQDLLPHCDVYITDWIDASQVPLMLGKFDMDDFIDYLIEFLQFLGPNLHVMAVCQPTVPTLAAIAIMSAMQDTKVPKSMILVGGPVDARQNPTVPSKFAIDNSISSLEKLVITLVPPNYPGYMRYVYPGFLQLAGFMSLNLERHITSHLDLFTNLLVEDNEKAEHQIKFYDEFLSVMDLPAEFYLQTIKEVFQDFSLAKGMLVSKGRKIDLDAIKTCALLGIEGENDDIAAVGQTKMALTLCKSIPPTMRRYYLQKGVGHYGVFSGSKFRNNIVPVISEFINTFGKAER